MTDETRYPIGRWDVQYHYRVGLWQRVTPPQLFCASFLVLVLLGTLGLKTLPGLYTAEELSWLDALFTSTSAVCVTGLIVVDTPTYFTFAGQAFILLLIQLGGLGMIAFTSLIIVSLGMRLSLRQQALVPGTTESTTINPKRLIRDAVLFTFAIEGFGALLLYIAWIPDMGWRDAAWPALFHSISAFCNAGFSTYSDSLTGFREQPFTLTVVSFLIIAGGIGFLTLEEVYTRYRAGREKRVFRISLHSRIVLAASVVLLLGGWVLFCVFEWHNTLAPMSAVDRIFNGMFISASGRTAGLNTVDQNQMTHASGFLTILLMMIGGSPGSTAGGIKTTTIALMGLLAWSRFRGSEVVSLQGRSIPEETIQRAVGLFVIAFGIVTLGIFVLTITESGGSEPAFLVEMFEAVSAFNTTGLSMGLTPRLSPAGRLTVIILMFVGRVGPLTFAAALAVRRERGPKFRYAYEDVAVG